MFELWRDLRARPPRRGKQELYGNYEIRLRKWRVRKLIAKDRLALYAAYLCIVAGMVAGLMLLSERFDYP